MESVRRVSLPWIPEDDLLLRNAVEAGGSLEALAKGAVQFSRGYTLQELRERWHSLLYDDDISAQASYHMFELEISGISSESKYRPESNCVRNKDAKRKKPDSIRKKYYAMRKKLRTEFSADIDMDFLEPDHCVIPVGDNVDQIGFFGDSMPDNLGFEEEYFDILRRAFPEAVVDVSVESEDTNVARCVNRDLYDEGHQNRIMGSCEFNENLTSLSRQGRDDNSRVNFNGSISAIDGSADEGIQNTFDGFDGRPQFHSPNSDCFSSLDAMVFSCDQTQQAPWTDMEDVKSPELPASIGLSIAPEGAENLVNSNADNETEKALNVGEIVYPDSLLNLPNEVESLLVDFDEKSSVDDNSTDPLSQKSCVSSFLRDTLNAQSSLVLPSTPEFTSFTNRRICFCRRNLEDLEIPCNDDIFLFIHPESPSFPYERQLDNSISPYAASSSPIEKEHESTFNSMVKEITKSSGSTSKVIDSLVKKEVHGVELKVVSNLPVVTELMHSAEMLDKESLDDSSVSDDENSEMDCDVPYFSDVESMILEMDLAPYNQDSHINRKVPSYQYDETKRTIIRLEQGARSSLQRAMTSQGAFAVLYGRYLRHYITKSEVLLGRSTDDIAVDIDLAQEGRANKISRRQAIIKMEANGSFFMKNLGRGSILLNGTVLLSGQVVNLCSGCLIEIKGMNFVFEINNGYVKKQLGNLCLNSSRKEEQC